MVHKETPQARLKRLIASVHTTYGKLDAITTVDAQLPVPTEDEIKLLLKLDEALHRVQRRRLLDTYEAGGVSMKELGDLLQCSDSWIYLQLAKAKVEQREAERHAKARTLLTAQTTFEQSFTKQQQSAMKIALENAGFNKRALNCLRFERCKTLADVIKFTSSELLKSPNCGRKTLIEIESVLKSFDLSLRPTSE